MSKVAVTLKIDVTKINKEKLFKGQKGTYLDATIFLDLGEADQYGNHGMITQSVSKEDKDAGVRGEILGNGKIVWREEQQSPRNSQDQAARQPAPRQQSAPPDFDDAIPFAGLPYLASS
ncbi:MAG: hypothetical protein EXR84_14070 [Gammaproteobacteria bacterium]|nr:hypothetical protein [Gammaproteobacteria bacterium]